MPPGTCYLSSRILAECFPELEVRYGTLTWLERGELFGMEHAWNVRPDGTIVDSTWQPEDGAEGITYADAEEEQP
jgi:hypothetical protein